MKKKQLQELHTKSIKELNELVKKAQEELVKLKVELGAGRLKDTQAMNKKRHDLARIKTILREKELLKPATTETQKV